MNEVFISMVTTPMSLWTLRAAAAIATSSRVMHAPPCTTAKEFRCSGRGSKSICEWPFSNFISSKPRCSTKGILTANPLMVSLPSPRSRRHRRRSIAR